MARTLELTSSQPVKVTATVAQAVYDAADVLDADAVDLELGIVQYTGLTDATVTVETSMQNEQDDGSWKTVVSFTQVTSGSSFPVYELKSLDQGFLRFLRWKVTVTGSGSLHFWLRGVARRYA